MPTPLETQHLDMRYAALRILQASRVSHLAASIARDGQHSPVLVTSQSVLVDGYHRVAALRQLGHDLVEAVELQVPAVEALVLAWKLSTGRRKSAMEDGWLLRELLDDSDLSAADLARTMGRSRSWVSQRLGLVGVLPESVQCAVRDGRVPAQAAMKSLLPMARKDTCACSELVAALKETVTVRQVATLYRSWLAADRQGRQRIVSDPHLLLRVDEVASTVPPDALERLVRDLERISSLCQRSRRALHEGLFARANRSQPGHAWQQASEAFLALQEEVIRAHS